MNRKLLLPCLLFASAALPVLGHHSFNMFDDKKELVLQGEVKEFQWSNPHTWIQLNVKDGAGKVVEWSIEGGSPNLLGRQGWKRNTLKPGDKVEITVHPLRDGQPGGSFMRAVFPDGRKLGGNQIPRGTGASTVRTLFGRVIGIIAGAALFIGAFVVSIVFFAVVLAIGLGLGGYFLWKTRHVRRQMRQQVDNRDVIEGTVISSEEIRSPDVVDRCVTDRSPEL